MYLHLFLFIGGISFNSVYFPFRNSLSLSLSLRISSSLFLPSFVSHSRSFCFSLSASYSLYFLIISLSYLSLFFLPVLLPLLEHQLPGLGWTVSPSARSIYSSLFFLLSFLFVSALGIVARGHHDRGIRCMPNKGVTLFKRKFQS